MKQYHVMKKVNKTNKSAKKTCLRAGNNDEGLHAGAGVVAVLLAEARIDHVRDAVDGERRFGDVGRHHHLTRVGRRRLEYLVLHVRRQVCVDGQHYELAGARS